MGAGAGRAGRRLAAVLVLTWVLAVPGVGHAASPASPAPSSAPLPTTTPDHGPWLLWLILGGFVGAGVLTLLLARHRSRGPRA